MVAEAIAVLARHLQESAPGATIVARIRHVSEQAFLDEDGKRFQFTWRAIQTWYSRYKKDGTTTVIGKPRPDKGRTCKMTPEELLEAIEQVRGWFRGRHNVAAIYRACIERGVLQRERVASHTFRRIVKAHELLKPDSEIQNTHRLAFAKAHANTLWQADNNVWAPRAARRCQGAIQAHRFHRRRQPRLLPRRILPRRKHRDVAESFQERALTPQALIFETQNETLDDSNRAVLPHGSETRPHAISLAPVAILGVADRFDIVSDSKTDIVEILEKSPY